MNDKEIILSYENYMRSKNMQEETIEYNLKVIRMFSQEVLYYFEQHLNTIDNYSFEEFTDMVSLIDEKLGGRDGICSMLNTFMHFTEFLKIKKLIKGGKIAYYKRMFSNAQYYLDKYDMMTGKRDDSKEYVKNLLSKDFVMKTIRYADEINLYGFTTLEMVDKIINDVPFGKKEMSFKVDILKIVLECVGLVDIKDGVVETTKRGRVISRLTVEERYAVIMYLIMDNVLWNSVYERYGGFNDWVEFDSIIGIFSSIFYKQKEVSIDSYEIRQLDQYSTPIRFANDKFRIIKCESNIAGSTMIDLCLEGMGLLKVSSMDNGDIIYETTEFGNRIFTLLYSSNLWSIKLKMKAITSYVKSREYDKAEKEIIKFVSVYGGNTVLWDYLGQIYLIKRNYKDAYSILRYAYETCSSNGHSAKAILYHLVLCCRKLKLKTDIEAYEEKLQIIERI